MLHYDHDSALRPTTWNVNQEQHYQNSRSTMELTQRMFLLEWFACHCEQQIYISFDRFYVLGYAADSINWSYRCAIYFDSSLKRTHPYIVWVFPQTTRWCSCLIEKNFMHPNLAKSPIFLTATPGENSARDGNTYRYGSPRYWEPIGFLGYYWYR